MPIGQCAQPVQVVEVFAAAHREVEVDGVVHARGDGASHNRQHRRQPRAATHAQHRPGVFAAQVRRAHRTAHPHGIARAERVEDVLRHPSPRHAAHLELHHLVTREARHRIGANVFWGELQRGVLARAEGQRLGQLERDAANVVRDRFDVEHRAFDDARGVGDHLVHIGNLDGAVAHQRGLTGQYLALPGRLRATGFRTAVQHLTVSHRATAGAAAPGQAAVGNGHPVRTQHLQQVLSDRRLQVLLQGLNDQLHRPCARCLHEAQFCGARHYLSMHQS